MDIFSVFASKLGCSIVNNNYLMLQTVKLDNQKSENEEKQIKIGRTDSR